MINKGNRPKLFFVTACLVAASVAGTIYVTSFTPHATESLQIKWEGAHSFSNNDDNTGFYERWCISHDGVWFEPDECRFEHRTDYNVAMRDLEEINHVEISARHAEQICDKMKIPCPENVVLDGYADTNTGNIRYAGYDDDMKVFHHFQIIGGSLFYKQGDIDDRWSPVITNMTRYNNEDGRYADLWQFDGDELGYYEKWCNVFDGDWINESYECGFADHQDYKAAKKDLRFVLSPVIKGT